MSCERWTTKHEAQLTWATDKINEARRERDELQMKVEKLSERVVVLTTRLNQGENQIRSVERICTFRTSDFPPQLPQLQGDVGSHSTSTANPVSSLNPMAETHLSPYILVLDVGTAHPVPNPVDPLPEPPRLTSPDIPIYWDFCNTSAQLSSSPRQADEPSYPRNTSMTLTSTRGENALLRKLIIRRMADLSRIMFKVVNDNTDLEKVKSLQTGTVPRVEKVVRELESTLRQYPRICDPTELDDVSDQVDAAIKEATKFVDNIAALYDKNEGYAPGLSGHEKSSMDIKPFTARSDVTIFEFLEKFSDYCARTKKIMAYKLYNNYLSASIQAQTASFQQKYDALIKFLKRKDQGYLWGSADGAGEAQEAG